MSAAARLLSDLEAAADDDPGRRLVMFRRIEALFLAAGLPDEDGRTAVFDQALSRLAGQLGGEERVAFARRIAEGGRYLPLVIGDLVLDEDVEVAAPVLEGPMELDEDLMVAVARERGEEHLLALAGREKVPEVVTDVMVRRGGSLVLMALAENPGARFGVSGFLVMSERSAEHPRLGAVIVSRADFARMVLEVEAEGAEAAARIPPALLAEAKAAARRTGDPVSARKSVDLMRRTGRLDEAALARMAGEGALLNTLAALSQMAGRPVEAAKAAETAALLGLGRPTVEAIRALCSSPKAAAEAG